VRLTDNFLVENAYVADHQQAQIFYDEIRQCLVSDILSFDVEPEVLTLNAASVREVNFEVEFHPLFSDCILHACGLPMLEILTKPVCMNQIDGVDTYNL
jgi:hypothetical protein